MKLPLVRGAIDPATQVERFGCPSVVDLEYKKTLDEPFTDLSNWNVVEETAGNVSVSGGVLSLISDTNAWGLNGVWRRAGGVPGYIQFDYEVSNVGALTQFNAGCGSGSTLPGNIASLPSFNTASNRRALRQTNSEVYRDLEMVVDVSQKIKMVVLNKINSSGLGKSQLYIDSVLVVDTEADYLSAVTIDPTTFLMCGRTGVTVKVWGYSEHFGGFEDTTPPTVIYTADAGAGKKWNNVNLSNFNFINGLSSPNATLKWYYGDNPSPTWSSELTLAQLQAVGNNTNKHRYFMIQAIQNSNGLVQCPVTELNAEDATEGLEIPAGGGGGSKTRMGEILGVKRGIHG